MKETKIRALIVDDELLARKFIRRILKHDPEFEIVGEATNGKEAVAMIGEEKPDLVFLDVQMPEMDGFGVLKAIGLNNLPDIIFTTAYESYAIRAFELHALDYLLKPFDQQRFRDALNYAKERLNCRQEEEGRLQIGALLDRINSRQEYLDRLIIRAGGRITFLHTREINWIEADDKYVHLHTDKGARMVRQTLTAMEAQLDPAKFVRIHRSAMVNLDRIRELQPLFNGEYSLLIDDKTKLTLSRKYKEKLFNLLGKPL
jgi:two-component system, LytTR family, response regulator